MSSILIRSPSGFSIPELTADPSSPASQSAWVLKQGSGGSGGGKLIFVAGLGMMMTKANTGGALSYKFSYQTLEGTIKRVTLT